MKDSSSTNSRITRIYRDTSRSPIYEGFVWKVEYEPALSHADRWFESEQEALDFAAEQNRRRAALAAAQAVEPPAGFTHDPVCGFCFPEEHAPDVCAPVFNGPEAYTADGSIGVNTAWSAADGVEFYVYIDVHNGTRLTLANAKHLHSVLGMVIGAIQAGTRGAVKA